MPFVGRVGTTTDVAVPLYTYRSLAPAVVPRLSWYWVTPAPVVHWKDTLVVPSFVLIPGVGDVSTAGAGLTAMLCVTCGAAA